MEESGGGSLGIVNPRGEGSFFVKVSPDEQEDKTPTILSGKSELLWMTK